MDFNAKLANEMQKRVDDLEKGKLLPLIALLEKKGLITMDELLDLTVKMENKLEVLIQKDIQKEE